MEASGMNNVAVSVTDAQGAVTSFKTWAGK
jgi:hypothetical protein